MPALTINKFYGGMSESVSYTSDSMSAYQENVDGKSQPEVLKLQRWIVEQNTTWTSLWNVFITDRRNNAPWFIYSLWENGEVYLVWWSLEFTFPWNPTIYNSILFWDNVISFYEDSGSLKLAQTNINANWSIDRASTTLDYGINEDLTQFEVLLDKYDPYCVARNDSEDILYFVWWNTVYSWLITQLPLFKVGIVFEDQVVWLTKSWTQYNVYLQNWRKYFRDGFSEQHDGYVDLWENIRYVKETKNYDYIVAWFGAADYSRMYISQWQSFQLVNRAKFVIDWSDVEWKGAYDIFNRYGNSTIAVDESNIYITNLNNRWIEAFGNRIQWLPQGTTMEVANEDYFDFWALFTSTFANTLYFSYRNNDWNCFIASLPYFETLNPDYQLEGKYITKKYVMWVRRVRQTYVEVRYDADDDTFIDLYVATDWSPNFELLKTFTWDSKNIKISSPDKIRVWYEFEYKIVLRSNDVDKTPKLYSMQITYEQADR